MRAIVYEDGRHRTFGPLTLLRAEFELRCGVLSLLDKLRLRRPGWPVSAIARPELADVVVERLPELADIADDDDVTLFLCARIIVDDRLLESIESLDGETLLTSGGSVVGARVSGGIAEVIDRIREVGEPGRAGLDRTLELPARVVEYPWELVRLTGEEIERDAPYVARLGQIEGTVEKRAHVVKPSRVAVGSGSTVECGAVLDATGGPVIVGTGVTVMSNAVVYGPACIGDGSLVKVGAKIYGGTSIGRVCKIGGEIEGCVFEGWSNKQHEGFLGHSYVGSWVNLGAATDNSDLKNNYEPVRVRIGGRPVDTGEAFFGSVIGDHTKTAIGTKLNTGTVIGVFCNVLSYGFPPNALRSFSWGTGRSFGVHDIEKALVTARRVMARRGIEMSSAEESLIRLVFEEARGAQTK